MNVKIWYEDNIGGLTNMTMTKNSEKEAKDLFNTYYGRMFKFVSIVRQK